MIYLTKFFGVDPEPQHLGGNSNQNSYNITEPKQEEQKPKKPMSKWRKLLQDWSNGDAQDLAFDDSRP